MVRYPDAQQLFVGNVPHDVDKTELKEFFERKIFISDLPPHMSHNLINERNECGTGSSSKGGCR